MSVSLVLQTPHPLASESLSDTTEAVTESVTECCHWWSLRVTVWRRDGLSGARACVMRKQHPRMQYCTHHTRIYTLGTVLTLSIFWHPPKTLTRGPGTPPEFGRKYSQHSNYLENKGPNPPTPKTTKHGRPFHQIPTYMDSRRGRYSLCHCRLGRKEWYERAYKQV